MCCYWFGISKKNASLFFAPCQQSTVSKINNNLLKIKKFETADVMKQPSKKKKLYLDTSADCSIVCFLNIPFLLLRKKRQRPFGWFVMNHLFIDTDLMEIIGCLSCILMIFMNKIYCRIGQGGKKFSLIMEQWDFCANLHLCACFIYSVR